MSSSLLAECVQGMKISTNKNQVKVVLIIILLFMTAVMLLNNFSVRDKQIALSQKQLLQEAIAHFDNMVDTRSWNALYGGVYVKPIPGLEPNPYLRDNTLKTHNGEQLIKINPAWMTRQISEIANKKRNYYYRITSLKPLNPNNEPDKFEREALTYFEDSKNKTESYYYRFNESGQEFDFMGKLYVEKSCLKCHAKQDYKEGDVRGGIRVSIPTTLYQQEVELIEMETTKRNIILVILSIIIIAFFIWFVEVIYGRQQEKERKQLLFDMGERIKELQCMYGITEIIQSDAKMEEVLAQAVKIIPTGWHHSESARARIILDDEIYVESYFELTEWVQSSDLVVHNQIRGSVEVYYLQEFPRRDCGPFSRQEQELINNIASALNEAIARKQAEIKLRHLATHDSLTGLLNRKMFEQKVSHEIARAVRYNHPLSILMLDIDHFKQVNDTYGHSAGDAVLKSFARILQQAVRETDSIARYGGEEFVIILPETSTTVAMELAERMRLRVAEHPVMVDENTQLNITVSIGIANFPEHAQNRSTLVDAADQAMYNAKEAGRNLVKIALEEVRNHNHDQGHE